jgi:hypothetical protein
MWDIHHELPLPFSQEDIKAFWVNLLLFSQEFVFRVDKVRALITTQGRYGASQGDEAAQSIDECVS